MKNYLHNLVHLVILILLILPKTLVAQVGYQFENFSVDHGLSDNRITCLLKDRAGFIWIGTENGLNRFDGQRFLTFNQISRFNLSNSAVNDLAEDQSGRLWVATQSGLNVIDPVSDSVAIFLSEDGDARINDRVISSNLIWDIYVDKSNQVWIAPDGKDLSKYDILNKKFTHFHWIDFVEQTFPSRKGKYNSIKKICYKSENELWLATSIGICSYNISNGGFTYYSSMPNDHFLQLENASNGSELYYSQIHNSPLQLLEIKGNQKHVTNKINIKIAGENRISPTTMSNMRWMPSSTGSLLEVNTINRKVSQIEHRLDDPRSIAAGFVRTAYKDNADVVWVGSSSGLGKFSPIANPFTFMPVFPTKPQLREPEKDLYPIENMLHTVFFSKQDQQYYISSPTHNSLVIMDAKTNKKKIISEIQGIPLIRCSVIYEDKKGRLWILANNRAFIYDRESKEFQVSAFQGDPKNPFISDMAEDDLGNFWFSCFNDGLYWYDHSLKKQKKIAILSKNKSLFPTSLFFDKNRRKLWIGTFGHGLFQYDFEKKIFLSFFANKNVKGAINTTLITDIIADKDSLWIATSAGGISKCAADNVKINGFRPITTVNGLPDNTFYNLQTDENGNVWANSFNGITKINVANNKIENFSQKNGLIYTDFYSPFTLTDDGSLLTGIQNGFLMFHPDSLHQASSPFSVRITSFKTDSMYEFGNKALNQKLIKPFTNDEIEFSFAALTYYFPKETHFEYQLVGVNKNWVNNGNRDNVKYNNLSPGNYSFLVRAQDFAGRPSLNVAKFEFQILPPWWQTWWMRTLATITIVGLIFWMYLYRISVVKKKVALQYQINSLKEQALRSQMNPHFIFNCLNAIQELIITEKYSASFEYLSKFSKLLRLVLQASEKNLISLAKEIEITRLYVGLESLRFKKLFEYHISYSEDIDMENISFPTLLLQPFVENAIWHGLLPKTGLKKLDITFEEKENNIICCIKDNGIGIDQAKKIKNRKLGARYKESKGIKMATQRLEILNRTGEFNGTIKLINIMNLDGSVGGTAVEIMIISNDKYIHD